MFENLDQNKEQNLAGNNNSPLTPPPLKQSMPAPMAPKAEDMFAGVKDASTAGKNAPLIPGASKMSMTEIKSSGNGLRIALITVIILIIIGLGGIAAVQFLGVDLSNPSSWAGKFSNLSSLFVKQQPGQTTVINNETPAQPPSPTPLTPPSGRGEIPSQGGEAQQPAVPSAVGATTETNPAASTTAVQTPATSNPSVPNPVASSSVEKSSSSAIIVDSDSDGLSNLEETALGTNPVKADTDGDSYSDKTEIGNLFNPLGTGLLSADPDIAEYHNSKKNYAVLYPKSFSIQDVLNNDGSVISFSAPAPSSISIEISVQPDTAKQDVLAFFNQQFPGNPAKSSDVISKNGLQGLFSPDNNKYYAVDDAKNKFYIITYNGNGNLSYYNIFLLIVHSLGEAAQ